MQKKHLKNVVSAIVGFIEKNHLEDHIPEIISVLEKKKNENAVQILVAEKLSENSKKIILNDAQKIIGIKKLKYVVIQDSSIGDGYIIKYRDNIWDRSLKTLISSL